MIQEPILKCDKRRNKKKNQEKKSIYNSKHVRQFEKLVEKKINDKNPNTFSKKLIVETINDKVQILFQKK